MLDVIYSTCLCVAGVLTGFGVGGFYPIAATLNTSSNDLVVGGNETNGSITCKDI